MPKGSLDFLGFPSRGLFKNLKQRYENYESSAALTTVVPARTMTPNSL